MPWKMEADLLWQQKKMTKMADSESIGSPDWVTLFTVCHEFISVLFSVIRTVMLQMTVIYYSHTNIRKLHKVMLMTVSIPVSN